MADDSLTPLEREAIASMVRHDHPVADAFRSQLDVCRVARREFTGVGFFSDLVVPPTLTVPGVGSITLGDAIATIPGLERGAGFVLFIADGRFSLLEAATYDESWPDEVKTFSIATAESLTATDLQALDRAYRRWQRTQHER